MFSLNRTHVSHVEIIMYSRFRVDYFQEILSLTNIIRHHCQQHELQKQFPHPLSCKHLRGFPWEVLCCICVQCPSEPQKSASMRLFNEKEGQKGVDQYPSISKRLLKALLTRNKSKNDPMMYSYLDEYQESKIPTYISPRGSIDETYLFIYVSLVLYLVTVGENCSCCYIEL